MPEYTIKRLPKLSKREVDRLVNLCLRAFAPNAYIEDLVGGDSSLKDLYFRSMIGAANVGSGQIYGAVEESTGKIVSFVVWAPPGKILIETPEERAQGQDELIRRLSPEAKKWREEVFEPLLQPFFEETLEKSVKDSWSISLVATDPDYQRRGLATQVIQTMLSKVRTQHRKSGDLAVIACGLEHLVKFYEGVGFQLKGHKVIPGLINPTLSAWTSSQWL